MVEAVPAFLQDPAPEGALGTKETDLGFSALLNLRAEPSATHPSTGGRHASSS